MVRICFAVFIILGCNESTNNASTLDTGVAPSDQSIPDTISDRGQTDTHLTDASRDTLPDAGIGDPTDFGANAADSGDTEIDSTDSGLSDPGQADSFVPTESDVGLQTDPDGGASGPTIWTGPRLTFTKTSRADPTSPEAQDFITENVILTRGNRNTLYNIARESRATPSVSPIGTLWALGTTADLDTLEFRALKEAVDRMRDVQGRDMVLFLENENIYIDVRFRSWTSGQNGGGFSYERTTPAEN